MKDSHSAKVGDAPTNSHFLNHFCEALCERDELDNYLSTLSGRNMKSILHCKALDDYESLFAFLQSSNPNCESSESLECIGNPERLVLGRVDHDLINSSLRTFGSSEWGWNRIHQMYFPTWDAGLLRSEFERGRWEYPEARRDIPKRWTVDEDFCVAYGIHRHGPGLGAVQDIFTSLHESRSVDEIVARVEALRPKKKRKRLTKPEVTEATTRCPSPSDEWDVDDSLLDSF